MFSFSTKYRQYICLAVALVGFSAVSVKGQTDYLEPIGGSEVELFFHLDSDQGVPAMDQNGTLLKLERDGFDATYTLAKGKVTNVSYHQSFTSASKAEEAFAEIKRFIESKGMKITSLLTSKERQVVCGDGNNMHSTLIVTQVSGGGYRLNAEISAMR
jgi:hypothetical protein